MFLHLVLDTLFELVEIRLTEPIRACIPLARVSVTAVNPESSVMTVDASVVVAGEAVRWRRAFAPASNPSASIDGIAEAFPLTEDVTEEATPLTRFVSPAPAFTESGLTSRAVESG
jgi:hypothetical protein